LINLLLLSVPAKITSPDPAATAVEVHLIIGRMARALRQAHTIGDLTHSEASTLARLERGGPTSPGSLAEEERVRPQAMTTTLAGLEAKGYVVRRSDPADGRRAIVTLTELGAEVRNGRRTESVRRLEHALTTTLDEVEITDLAAVLPLLGRVAEAL
jgi:DNA-binding MarR family transcriptional regulator